MKKNLPIILDELKKKYPDVTTSLDYETPFQLLIATILSAQCTDERVNIVTKELFAKYPDAKTMAKAELADLKRIIFSTGFYNSKAKNILASSQMIIEKFNGTIPDTMDALTLLPGVARKTANCVLGSAFQKAEGVVVDTHVQRITRRLGLTKERTPEKIEQDLMKILPKSDWIWFSHTLVEFGRETCDARKPKCDQCPLQEVCPFAKKQRD